MLLVENYKNCMVTDRNPTITHYIGIKVKYKIVLCCGCAYVQIMFTFIGQLLLHNKQ